VAARLSAAHSASDPASPTGDSSSNASSSPQHATPEIAASQACIGSPSTESASRRRLGSAHSLLASAVMAKVASSREEACGWGLRMSDDRAGRRAPRWTAASASARMHAVPLMT